MNAAEFLAEFRALQDRVQVLEERLSAEEQVSARLWREALDDLDVKLAAAQQPLAEIRKAAG